MEASFGNFAKSSPEQVYKGCRHAFLVIQVPVWVPLLCGASPGGQHQYRVSAIPCGQTPEQRCRRGEGRQEEELLEHSQKRRAKVSIGLGLGVSESLSWRTARAPSPVRQGRDCESRKPGLLSPSFFHLSFSPLSITVPLASLSLSPSLSSLPLSPFPFPYFFHLLPFLPSPFSGRMGNKVEYSGSTTY